MLRHHQGPTCPHPQPQPRRPSPPAQEELDTQLAAVFGTADLTSSKTLSLTEWLHCLHVHSLQRIRARPTLRSMKRGGSGGEAVGTAPAGAAAAK